MKLNLRTIKNIVIEDEKGNSIVKGKIFSASKIEMGKKSNILIIKILKEE